MIAKQEKEPILVRIDEAARELLNDQPDGIIPVSGNFTIVQLFASATTRSTTLAPRPGTCIGSSLR